MSKEETDATEDFLAKFEAFLQNEVGGKWYYEFEGGEDTLNFPAFSVWGKQFGDDDDEK